MTTAAQLERMTMAERQAHLRASIVRDLDQLPDGFLQTIRSRLQARIDGAAFGM